MAILPSRKTLVDASFSMETILSKAKTNLLGYFVLRNLRGIDIDAEPFKIENSNYEQMIGLGILLSTFDIYSNRTLVDSSQCEPNTYLKKIDFSIHFLT